MAKEAQDREDLMRDAVTLKERIELRLPHESAEIVCGFRQDGSLSIYWGQNEVIQFNANAEFRRGFWRESMIATYKRKLHWLRRDTTPGRTRLSRQTFSDEEQDTYLKLVMRRLNYLHEAIGMESCTIVDQRPKEAHIQPRLLAWLNDHTSGIQLAIHPGVGRGKPHRPPGQ